MSNDTKSKPVVTIGIRRKEGDAWKSYSTIAVCGTKHDGLFNGNVDKGTDKRPAMNVIDAIKALASGASLEIRVNKPGSARQDGGGYSAPHPEFADEDLPF